jgi:NAD(P)H-dependent flavin oxidoreductase YrpB (nitropropane dioxygenase family)
VQPVRDEVAAAVAERGMTERGVLIGTGVDSIKSVEPVADVIESICSEAERLLRRFG